MQTQTQKVAWGIELLTLIKDASEEVASCQCWNKKDCSELLSGFFSHWIIMREWKVETSSKQQLVVL